MKRLVGVVFALTVSGCCCGLQTSSDGAWERAVSRRGGGPATGGAPVGSANRFRLELFVPQGHTLASLAARQNAAEQRQALELELSVTEKKVELGVVGESTLVPKDEALAHWGPVLERQRAEVAALPPMEPLEAAAPLELHERWRFVTVYPPVPEAEEDGFISLVDGQPCAVCIAEAARGKGALLRSFGRPGIDLAHVSPEQLRAGHELTEDQLSVSGFDVSSGTSVPRPPGAKLVLTLEDSCAATVKRVDDTLTVGKTSGMINLPKREAVYWYELRGASCLGGRGAMTHEVLSAGGQRPSLPFIDHVVRFRLTAAQAELERLAKLPAP